MTTVSLAKTTPSTSLRIFMALFGVVIGIFLALVVIPAQSAFAGGCPDPANPLCTETGGGDGGGGGGPDPENPGPDDTQPTGQYNHEYVEPKGSASFSLHCTNWSGSGGYQPSASCNTTKDAIKNANPLSPKEGGGYGTGGGGGTYGLNATGCGNGTISPFKQNWFVRNTADYSVIIYVYADGHTSTGEITWEGTDVNYAFQGCVAPTPQYQYTRCYWNNQGNAAYSINRNASLGSWNTYYVRPWTSGDPSAPSGGYGNVAPSGKCTGGTSVSHNVMTAANVDKYGYYTIVASFNHRLYTHTQWVGDGTVWYAPGWSAGGTSSQSNRYFYTYSCITNGNAIKGPYYSQAATPNVDAYTNSATCPQVSWQCKLGTPTTIGLDRAAVLSGSVSPTSKATVMRNGEKVNIDFANVRVVDTSTSRDIDITDGGSAPGVRNITSIEYTTKVAPGSTPFFGNNSAPKASDTNTTQQYFKYFANRSTNTIEKFYTWLPNNNANQNKAISFNWASDASAPFKVTRNYRIAGEFLTPGGASVGTGGAVNTGYIWKYGSYECRDFSGRGSGRIDIGPLVSTSNPVEVVRSVNQ